MEPKFGVAAADHACVFKDCVKSTALDKGYTATFMCNPVDKTNNGFHLNFSIWKDGKNLFTDENDPEGLSTLGKYWLAGLMKHAKAVGAIICPHNISFTRLHNMDLNNICYGKGKRKTMLRVTENPNSDTYVEFRSPGASANPYLVMSVVLAAGMDGLREKKMVCLSFVIQVQDLYHMLQATYTFISHKCRKI